MSYPRVSAQWAHGSVLSAGDFTYLDGQVVGVALNSAEAGGTVQAVMGIGGIRGYASGGASLVGIADSRGMRAPTIADALRELEALRRRHGCDNCGAKRWVNGACYYCGEER